MIKLSDKIKYGPSFQSAQVEERTLRLPPACAGLEGRTLLFLSDVHLSDRFPPDAVRNLIAQIQSLNPDMLLLGGDYGESAKWQRQFFRLLSRVSPPLGVYGVLGNNDYECFPEKQLPLVKAAGRAGAQLLIDETVRLTVDGCPISIAGLDEYRHSRQPEHPLFDTEDQSALRIMLSHYPQSCCRYLRRMTGPMPHFAMSGHTHGGQFRLLGLTPYSIGYELDLRWYMTTVSGWKQVKGCECLVSPGLGTSQLPYRINADPTIHLLKFTK